MLTQDRAEWHHVGVVVEDLDAATEFYAAVAGFEVTFRPPPLGDLIRRTLAMPGIDCRLVQGTVPGSSVQLELLEFSGVSSDADSNLPVWPGVSHNAFVVPDVDRAVGELQAAGGRPIGEIVEYPEGRAVYCWTGVGAVVELEESTPMEVLANEQEGQQ